MSCPHSLPSLLLTFGSPILLKAFLHLAAFCFYRRARDLCPAFIVWPKGVYFYPLDLWVHFTLASQTSPQTTAVSNDGLVFNCIIYKVPSRLPPARKRVHDEARLPPHRVTSWWVGVTGIKRIWPKWRGGGVHGIHTP